MAAVNKIENEPLIPSQPIAPRAETLSPADLNSILTDFHALELKGKQWSRVEELFPELPENLLAAVQNEADAISGTAGMSYDEKVATIRGLCRSSPLPEGQADSFVLAAARHEAEAILARTNDPLKIRRELLAHVCSSSRMQPAERDGYFARLGH
jgi:hypothetical protein